MKTGTTTEGRTQYNKLKKLIIEKKVDVVLMSFLDRLGRESFEFLSTIELMKENDIEGISISEHLFISKMSAPEIAMRAIAIEIENKARQKRIHDSKNYSLSKGEYIYITPYGYNKDENRKLIINKEEANVIVTIYEMFLSGKKMLEIAKNLNEGNKNNQKKWNTQQVKTILTKEMYAGVNNKNNNIKYPQIISEIYYKKASKILNENKREMTTEPKKYFHLLTKILLCSNCSKKMSAQIQNDSYKCNHCKKVRYKKSFVDTAIKTHLYSFNKESGTNLPEVTEHLLKDKQEIEKKFARAQIDLDTYEKAVQTIFNEMDRIKSGNFNKCDDFIETFQYYAYLVAEENLEQLKNRLIGDEITLTYNSDDDSIKYYQKNKEVLF